MIFRLLLFLGLGLATPVGLAANWETLRLDGQDYVTARSIQEFYRFDTMEIQGTALVLECDAIRCSLPLEGTEAIFNGVHFHLPTPLLQHEGNYLVSRLTLIKLIEPVLRPSYIKRDPSPNFNTIALDYDAPAGEESDALARRITRTVQDTLTRRGFKVVPTQRDETLPVEQRLKTINDLEDAIVLSLQLRHTDDQDEGFRTWIFAPAGVPATGENLVPDDFKPQAANAHDAFNIAIAASLHGIALQRTKRPDRGIAHSRRPLLAGSTHPTIVLDLGNLAHPGETAILESNRFQGVLAEAIVQGLNKARRATRLPPPAPAD